MKFTALLAAAAAFAAFAAPAAAQFAKAEDAIKYRQGALFVMGQHFARIGAMVNGRIPYDAKAAIENAEVVAAVAKLPWAGFGAGTEKGWDTRAQPDIWLEPAKFKEHQDKLLAEAPKLLAAARTNNLDNLKTAFSAAAGTCKGCHDDYRKE